MAHWSLQCFQNWCERLELQEDRSGYYVLVVDTQDQVEVRRIVTGDQVDSDWVVRDGLAQGERVIVQGVQKVQAGMKVNAVSGEG